jgi:hypothetical protein
MVQHFDVGASVLIFLASYCAILSQAFNCFGSIATFAPAHQEVVDDCDSEHLCKPTFHEFDEPLMEMLFENLRTDLGLCFFASVTVRNVSFVILVLAGILCISEGAVQWSWSRQLDPRVMSRAHPIPIHSRRASFPSYLGATWIILRRCNKDPFMNPRLAVHRRDCSL